MLIQVVTRRSWCGSGSMLRSLRSMKCASGPPMPRVGCGQTGSGAAHTGRVAITEQPAGRDAGCGGGGADDDVAGVVGGAARGWLRSVAAGGPACPLRGAISGKHKSDVIDADVLARAGEVFDLHPLRPVEPAQLALRRACVRRGGSVIDGNRHLRRLISLARWAFPDVERFRGSLPTAVAVLDRWPHLAQLAAARRSTLTAVVAYTRGVADVPDRVEAIRSAAAAWAAFWAGHLDLDALAFDVTEHLTDMADAKARTERATGQAQRYWRQLYGDDELLLSVPGMGPVTASVIRGFLADGTAFASGKAAASYVGLEPVDLVLRHGVPAQSGDHQGRPAVLRLAFFQAANAARRQDPQLAGFYHQLMTQQGHCHTQACVAVARKLVERTWTVLSRGTPYQIRDLDGQPISRLEAKKMIKQVCTVPDEIRAKGSAHSAATNRAKLTR